MLKIYSTRFEQTQKKTANLHFHNSLVSSAQALSSCCKHAKKFGLFMSRDSILSSAALEGLANLLDISNVPCSACYEHAINWQKKSNRTHRHKTEYRLGPLTLRPVASIRVLCRLCAFNRTHFRLALSNPIMLWVEASQQELLVLFHCGCNFHFGQVCS